MKILDTEFNKSLIELSISILKDFAKPADNAEAIVHPVP